MEDLNENEMLDVGVIGEAGLLGSRELATEADEALAAQVVAETFEDFEAMSPDEVNEALVIDDDALVRGGMVPVKAFVRSKASANALRQRRKRQQQAEGGARQLSVQAPADDASRNAIKAVGAAMREHGLDAGLVEQLAKADPVYASKLFALDTSVVERVAACDVAVIDRLFEVAAMLDRDPAYVMQVLRLDQELVRRVLSTDQALVAQLLATTEANLRKTVELAAATEAQSKSSSGRDARSFGSRCVRVLRRLRRA